MLRKPLNPVLKIFSLSLVNQNVRSKTTDSNFESRAQPEGKGKMIFTGRWTIGMRLHLPVKTSRDLEMQFLQAKAFVGNEPFVVMLGDDLMDITDDRATTAKLMNDYDDTHASNCSHEFLMKMFLLRSDRPSRKASTGYTVLKLLLKSQHLRRHRASCYHRALPLDAWDLIFFENQEPGAGTKFNSTDAIDTSIKHNASSPGEFGQSMMLETSLVWKPRSIMPWNNLKSKMIFKQYIIELGKKLEASEKL